MKHRFGIYLHADLIMVVAALLKQLRGRVRLTGKDFEYPHPLVSVLQRVFYSPEYKVSLKLVMHDGYKRLIGGDAGQHKKLRVFDNGVITTRNRIPPTVKGYVFERDPEMDYRITIAALTRRLGGDVVLRESDFPEHMGVGTGAFSVSMTPFPLTIDLELERSDRASVAMRTPQELHGSGLIHAG